MRHRLRHREQCLERIIKPRSQLGTFYIACLCCLRAVAHGDLKQLPFVGGTSAQGSCIAAGACLDAPTSWLAPTKTLGRCGRCLASGADLTYSPRIRRKGGNAALRRGCTRRPQASHITMLFRAYATAKYRYALRELR